ncbi:MAG: DMT family transporter [Acidimicrobiales bacterium]|nr:DMT family transporter [Acidimicrobiales bacterium]
MTTDVELASAGATDRRPVAAGGLALALASAAAFATSGPFAKSLLDAGWTPGAAVTTRISVAGAVLSVPTVLSLRGRWSSLRRNAGLVTLYGLVAVAGCQFAYFNAVRTLSVGVALLLEYLGLILVVAWNRLVQRHPLTRATVAGVVLAVVGLVLVLDLFGGGSKVDVVGVLWGLAAAVGLATFFVASAHDSSGLPPIAMAGAGMLIGAVALCVAALTGLLPFEWATEDVTLADVVLPWWVPVVGLSVVAGALSYATGIAAARRLGAKVAAFAGLTEVLFAVVFSWILLDQALSVTQIVGGVLILGGVAVVRSDASEVEVPTVGAEALP